MIKYVYGFLILIYLLAGYAIAYCIEKPLNLKNAPKGTIIKIDINIEKERDVQKQVEQGHQPWRLEPEDVAFSTITGDPTVKYETCKLIRESVWDAEVRCAGDNNTYVVYLKKIFKTNGIWTAISIQVK